MSRSILLTVALVSFLTASAFGQDSWKLLDLSDHAQPDAFTTLSIDWMKAAESPNALDLNGLIVRGQDSGGGSGSGGGAAAATDPSVDTRSISLWNPGTRHQACIVEAMVPTAAESMVMAAAAVGASNST